MGEVRDAGLRAAETEVEFDRAINHHCVLRRHGHRGQEENQAAPRKGNTQYEPPAARAPDGVRGPAAGWLAGPTAEPASTAPCTPTFQLYDLKLAAEPRTARAPAPVRGGTASASDSVVTVDVLAVVDLDGDGRRELVLAMKFATVRSIVVYTATENVQRLELAGEGQSFR